MSKVQDESNFKLINVRLSFPELFAAKGYNGGAPKFSATFLIPKDSPQVANLKAAISQIATKKWGAKAGEVLKSLMAQDRICLHDGDLKPYEGYAGNFALRASNDVKPLLLDRNRQEIVDRSTGKLYSGCYVIANISLWCQDNGFGKRVNANLRGVQFYADGEAFTGGGTASADEFEALDAGADTLSAQPGVNALF